MRSATAWRLSQNSRFSSCPHEERTARGLRRAARQRLPFRWQGSVRHHPACSSLPVALDSERRRRDAALHIPGQRWLDTDFNPERPTGVQIVFDARKGDLCPATALGRSVRTLLRRRSCSRDRSISKPSSGIDPSPSCSWQTHRHQISSRATS